MREASERGIRRVVDCHFRLVLGLRCCCFLSVVLVRPAPSELELRPFVGQLATFPQRPKPQTHGKPCLLLKKTESELSTLQLHVVAMQHSKSAS